MVEKIRKSEEEKVIEMLKREGFRELNKKEIQKEPYKSIYRLPECFDENTGTSENQISPKYRLSDNSFHKARRRKAY